jgi:hypothetical protein
VAPVTEFQRIEAVCVPVADASSPVGTPVDVVAETHDEGAELPLLLLERTS